MINGGQRRPQATARTGHRPRWDWEENACGARPLATVDQKADNDGRRPRLATAAGHSSLRPQAEVGLGGERLVGPLPEGDAGGGLRDAQQDAEGKPFPEGPGRRAGIWEAGV